MLPPRAMSRIGRQQFKDRRTVRTYTKKQAKNNLIIFISIVILSALFLLYLADWVFSQEFSIEEKATLWGIPAALTVSAIGYIWNPEKFSESLDGREIETMEELAYVSAGAAVEVIIDDLMDPDNSYDPKEPTPGEVEKMRHKYD